MNNRLKNLLEEYAELERNVQELVSAQCRDVCELCTSCCCRADLCEEAIDSPFLRLLHERSDLESDRYGFLTEAGCALPVGRPPVCYEFFCEEVLSAQPDDDHRHLLRILGALPTHAGQNARGNAHLVEIMHKEDLDQLNFDRLEKQLHECFQALGALQTFYTTGALPNNADKALCKISLSSEN